MKHDFNKIAHEIWAAAQLFPGEGIENGADRIEIILKETMVKILEERLERMDHETNK